MLTKNRYDLAMADANDAVRLAPGDFLYILETGETWFKQADYARALADYDVAVNLGTNVAASYQVAPGSWPPAPIRATATANALSRTPPKATS